MERGKSSSSRGAKSKITQYPPDIFALGSKPSSSRDESKRSTGSHKPSSSSHSSSSSKVAADRKRDHTSSLAPVPPAKKSKVTGSVIRSVTGASPSGSTSSVSSTSSTTTDRERSGERSNDRSTTSTTHTHNTVEFWETLAVETETCNLVPNIKKALDNGDNDKIVGYITGAVKTLRTQRYKPDKCLYLSLIHVVKERPDIFINEHITAALSSLLKRSIGDTPAHSLKTKSNPIVPVVCANILLKAYFNERYWPELFVKLYVEDALGDRIWVDNEECKGFVDNIITAFNTHVPPKSLLTPELSGALGNTRDTSSPIPSTGNTTNTTEEDGRHTPDASITGMENIDIPIQPRYLQSYEIVEQIVLDAINEQFKRKQPQDTITRNFLRLLSSACGLVEIRMIAVNRLEMWLHNAKLMRPAQELLAYVCSNCSSVTQRDLEVTAQLTKIRLKTKALLNVYLNCLRELVTVHPENLPPMLKSTIYNELSSTRNSNNMQMIAVMFQASPETSANVLAEIFQDLLIHRDDYLRSLRALLREIVRVLRYDINLYVLCRSLVKERKEISSALRDFEYRDRVFLAIADLLCLCMFLGISQQVKEAAQLIARGDKKEIATLQNYQLLGAKIQREAVVWLHERCLQLFRPSVQDFMHVLHKVLFLESAEQYYKIDNWPSETDRSLLIRLASEVPLLQATLIRLLLIGISKEHPVNAADTLEITDQLIKRAAALPCENFPTLQADKLEIIDFIFNLTAYHHPENITLPSGYTPPQLAISNLYWKGWIMLLMLSAHNPNTFGNLAWKKYPMLRTFMEMCITNHFSYPPPTVVAMGEVYDEMKNKELQISALEKQQILEFESHLASVVINEQNSLLLPQLIEMKPSGDSRPPPNLVLEQLHSLNNSHRMGHLLCRSRHPDFLLDIIQRQGSSQHMPWLADLVHNSEGALSHLPVQCLCEYLLISGMQASSEKNEKHQKHSEVLAHLQMVLTDPNQEVNAAYEILEYFLRRLNSLHFASRVQAIKGLKMILSTVQIQEEEPMTIDEDNLLDSSNERDRDLINYWLVKQIPVLPHFQQIRHLIVPSLRQACQVETDPDNISSYINFLAQQTVHDTLSEMTDLVLDLAQLIVERATITTAVLPVPEHESKAAKNTLHSLITMFCTYMLKIKEARHEALQWTEIQDQLLVSWGVDDECAMHSLVIHAMIILLTYGPANDPNLFDMLLETWFPINSPPPKAYQMDTSEPTTFIPDWLKLRMIRSNVARLVDAALVNLDHNQLVLFIQSFGIPVTSMSKLLCMLDAIVISDKEAVNDAVIDKTYMAQLVEVQHRRGATGGNTFVQVLQLYQPKLPDDAKMETSPTRQTFPQTIKSPDTRRKSVDTNNTIMLLNAIFLKSNYDGHIDKDFGNLMRNLAQEIHIRNKSKPKRILKMIVDYFSSSMVCPDFTRIILLNESYSCPLFRLLLSSKDLDNELTDLTKSIFNKIPDKKSPLATILNHYLRRQQHRPPSKINKSKNINGDPVEVLGNTDLGALERTTKCLVEHSLQKGNNSYLVDAMSKLLLTDVECKRIERTGLLVDWIAELEMEIIGTLPDVQMQLLFLKKPSTSTSVSIIGSQNWMCFRPYLLTLLTHRVSWRALCECVTRLLNPQAIKKYDAEAVLDFLWALTCNPKLWQGRDKFTPKNYKSENVLQLNNHQVLILVDYMIEEALQASNSFESEKNSIQKIESRLPLLQQSLNERYDIISSVAKHLIGIIKDKDNTEDIDDVIVLDETSSEVEEPKKSKTEISQEFLILLYMRIPKVMQYISPRNQKEMKNISKITECSTSLIDNISHSLFTALASTPRSKDWPKKSHEFELLTRKMAATHPTLVLRQLPMIAASLKGRTHLDFGVFKSRNHLNLFVQVLGVAELLQPLIFNKEYKDGLEGVLMAYFSLFRFHGHVKELQTMLGKFVNLLQAYISFDATRALKYLQQHAHLLNDLHLTYSNLRSLRVLMSSISLPKEENPLIEASGEGGEVLVAVARAPSPEPMPPNWNNLVLGLNRFQDDELPNILQEIDHLSNRRPVILDSIVDQLCVLITSPTGNVRQLGHLLLLRYLRHRPAAASNQNRGDNSSLLSPILAAVLRALDSPNAEVVNNVLDRLSEYVVCLQEHAIRLLEKAFLLGIKSNINTTMNINKAIGILNIQSGC